MILASLKEHAWKAKLATDIAPQPKRCTAHAINGPHESRDLRVVSGLGYHGTSPGMADEDDWTILHGDNPTGRIDIVRQRGQRVLNGDNMKAAGLKNWNDLGPAGTVCKCAVNENEFFTGCRGDCACA